MQETGYTKDISIVLVNYNTTQLTLDCIASVYNTCLSLRIEIIVIDNASSPSPETEIRTVFPDVIFVRNSANEGFARASNKGMRLAAGKYILLLNADTILLNDCLVASFRYMENKAGNTAILGARLLNADHTLQHSYFWSANTFKKPVQENALYNFLFRDAISRKARKIQAGLHTHTSSPPWLSGAFMLLPSELVRNENFFLDEDFFMYSEDVELCYRVQKRGYGVTYFPGAELVHLGGGGENVPLKRMEQMQLSEWLCILKTKGRAALRLYWMLQSFNHWLDDAILRRNRRKARVSFADLRQAVYRKKTRKLLRQYRTFILREFKKQPSSARQYLKYDPQKTT